MIFVQGDTWQRGTERERENVLSSLTIPLLNFAIPIIFFLRFFFFTAVAVERYQHTDHAEKIYIKMFAFFRFALFYLFLNIFFLFWYMEGMCNSLLLTTFFDAFACRFFVRIHIFFARQTRQIDRKMRHREKQLIGLLCVVNKYGNTIRAIDKKQHFVLPYFFFRLLLLRSCVFFSLGSQSTREREKKTGVFIRIMRQMHEIATKSHISPYLLFVNQFFFSSFLIRRYYLSWLFFSFRSRENVSKYGWMYWNSGNANSNERTNKKSRSDDDEKVHLIFCSCIVHGRDF